MLRFDEQVVVITGAGGGLGREYALLLASRGARVLVNDYGGDVAGQGASTAPAETVAAEIRAAGGEAIADATDVSRAGAGEVIVRAALDAWGRVDAVVNNAGATRGGVELSAVTDADFEFTLDVHVMGTVRVTRAAWPHMVAQGAGRVVNTSSDSLWGAPVHSYLTAKGAIFGFSRAAAAEGKAHGIAVNTVMPSAWTRMTSGLPAGEFRDVVEATFPPAGVAPMVAVLAHQSCPFTGESFQVGANRAARIFTGVTPGYHATSGHPVEELAAHVEDVAQLDGWSTPRDMVDSVNVAISHLRAST